MHVIGPLYIPLSSYLCISLEQCDHLLLLVGDMPQDEKADSVLSVLKDMKIIAAMVLGAYSGIIWSSMDPILEPELRNKYGLSQSVSALSFLLLSVCYAISAPIVGKSLDSFVSIVL